MFIDEILTTANDALLISHLGLTDEVDGRDPAVYIGERVSPEVAVEKENRTEEKECQQSERISGTTPKEWHGVCWTLWVGLRC
jgi:hypothetical protein